MSRAGFSFFAVALSVCAQAAFAPAAVAGPHDALIARHAAVNGVPESLVRRVIRIESRGNPRVVSKGNFGLMQIRLGTARALGYSGTAEGLLDPDTNMTYAVKYLAGAYRAAGCNENRAVSYYQRGYYGKARSKCGPPPVATTAVAKAETNALAQPAARREQEAEFARPVAQPADVLKPKVVQTESISKFEPAATRPQVVAKIEPVKATPPQVAKQEPIAVSEPSPKAERNVTLLEVLTIPKPVVNPPMPVAKPAAIAKAEPVAKAEPAAPVPVAKIEPVANPEPPAAAPETIPLDVAFSPKPTMPQRMVKIEEKMVILPSAEKPAPVAASPQPAAKPERATAAPPKAVAALEPASVPLPPVKPELGPMTKKQTKSVRRPGHRHAHRAKKAEEPTGLAALIKKITTTDSKSSKRRSRAQAPAPSQSY